MNEVIPLEEAEARAGQITPDLDLENELTALAKLSLIEYDQQREAECLEGHTRGLPGPGLAAGLVRDT